MVVCGSLPPGVTPSAFGRLCRRIVAAGVRLAVDTSGPALRAAAEAGAHLVKPNREELSDVVGHPLPTRTDVVEAADRVRAWGAGAVLASLGAEGAILVTADTVVSGAAVVPAPRSSVGAGDALLAGFLAALTRSDVDGPATGHAPIGLASDAGTIGPARDRVRSDSAKTNYLVGTKTDAAGTTGPTDEAGTSATTGNAATTNHLVGTTTHATGTTGPADEAGTSATTRQQPTIWLEPRPTPPAQPDQPTKPGTTATTPTTNRLVGTTAGTRG